MPLRVTGRIGWYLTAPKQLICNQKFRAECIQGWFLQQTARSQHVAQCAVGFPSAVRLHSPPANFPNPAALLKMISGNRTRQCTTNTGRRERNPNRLTGATSPLSWLRPAALCSFSVYLKLFLFPLSKCTDVDEYRERGRMHPDWAVNC